MSVSGSHDLVHWTTREDSVLYYFDLSRTKPEVRTVKLPGNDTVARKVVYAAQTMDYGIGPCSINNGGCSHVCLPALSNRTCLCPSGMVLRRNNVTCTGKGTIGVSYVYVLPLLAVAFPAYLSLKHVAESRSILRC